MTAMSQINSPLGQLAKIYGLIEASLRKAATHDKPITLSELNNVPEIKSATKSPYQVRDCISSLRDKGHLIQQGDARAKTYMWNVNSPSFIIRTKQREKINKQPSIASVTKPIIKPEPDYELVIGTTLLTISKNPSTGNTRIVIEELK